MYIRTKQFFGRGIFTKFIRKTIRKVSAPTLKRVFKKVISNPVLKKVVRKIGKNKQIRNLASEGTSNLVDHIFKKTPKNANNSSNKTKIIEAIRETAKDVSRLPEIKQLATSAGEKLLKNIQQKPNSNVTKTLSEITKLFSKKKSKKSKKSKYTPVLKKAKKRILQNIKKRSNKGWKRLTIGNGLILD